MTNELVIVVDTEDNGIQEVKSWDELENIIVNDDGVQSRYNKANPETDKTILEALRDAISAWGQAGFEGYFNFYSARMSIQKSAGPKYKCGGVDVFDDLRRRSRHQGKR